MKKIVLKTFTIKANGSQITYEKIIEQACNAVPREGIATTELHARLKIITAVENAKNRVLELDDASYNKLKDLIKQSRWFGVDAGFLQFVEDVENAKKEVEKTEKPKK